MKGISRDYLLGREIRDDKISVSDVVLIVIVLLLIAITVTKTFFLAPVQVSGSSMETTVQDGDWLLMRKTNKVTYGDVIIVRTSGSGDNSVYYIKRVIALAGDTVYTKNGEVYRVKNGETEAEKLSEPYASYLENVGGEWVDSSVGGTFAPPTSQSDMPETVVGEGEVFFMGDNRRHSRDSREIGTRKISDIIGVVPSWAIENRRGYAWYFDFTQSVSRRLRGIFN